MPCGLWAPGVQSAIISREPAPPSNGDARQIVHVDSSLFVQLFMHVDTNPLVRPFICSCLQAVRTVKSVLANLEQQGLASLPDWQLQHSAGASSNSLGMPPGLLALREDLRLELRQQCSAQLREHVIRLPMCGVEGFAALLAIQEHAFLARVCPLVHNLALLP
jgi:hypothetical protein